MNRLLLTLSFVAATTIGCAQEPTTTQPTAVQSASNSVPAATTSAAVTSTSNSNGIAGSMPAFYERLLRLVQAGTSIRNLLVMYCFH